MRQGGLTIIEILVALVIIGVTFAALASWQIGNMRIVRSSKQASIATQVANVAMERAVKEFLTERSQDPDPHRTGKAAFSCGTEHDDLDCVSAENFYDIEVDGAEYTATYSYTLDTTPGTVSVQVDVSEPFPLQLNQLISCMDVIPPPSFADPRPCPTPPGWTPPPPPAAS